MADAVRLAAIRARAWAKEVHAKLRSEGVTIPPVWPRNVKDAYVLASLLSTVSIERGRLTQIIHIEARAAWIQLIKGVGL